MKKMLKRCCCYIDTGVKWVEDLGCVISLAAICILVFAIVFCRYVLKTGIMWGAEIQEVLIVALAMFGCARATRTNGHTELGAVLNALPKVPRIVMRMLVTALSMAFLIAFLITSYQYTVGSGALKTIMLKIPYKYFYMLMPIGMLLTVYEFIKKIPERIFKKPTKEF